MDDEGREWVGVGEMFRKHGRVPSVRGCVTAAPGEEAPQRDRRRVAEIAFGERGVTFGRRCIGETVT